LFFLSNLPLTITEMHVCRLSVVASVSLNLFLDHAEETAEHFSTAAPKLFEQCPIKDFVPIS
jgi:hypothetical protein